MRKKFLRDMFTGTLGERFDVTKRVSDYAGMLTRIVFTTFLTGFAFDTVDWDNFSILSLEHLSRVGIATLLLVLTIVLGIGFVNVTQLLVIEIFWIEPYRGDSSARKYISATVGILLGLIALAAAGSAIIAVPKITSEVADMQRGRIAKTSSHQDQNLQKPKQ